MEEIKFRYNGNDKTLNKAFWKNSANLKEIAIEVIKNEMKNAAEKYYENCSYEKAKYFLQELGFKYYVVENKEHPEKQATTQVKEYFEVEDTEPEIHGLLKKQIAFSDIIWSCAKNTQKWFENLCQESLKNANEAYKDKEIQHVLDGSGKKFRTYLWYKWVPGAGENPISVSIYLYDDGTFRVCIALQKQQAQKGYLSDLYDSKLTRIFDIVKRPEKYGIETDKYEKLKFVITGGENPDGTKNTEGAKKTQYLVKTSDIEKRVKVLEVPEGVKVDEDEKEQDLALLNKDDQNLMFFFDDITEIKSDEDAINKIIDAIKDIMDLYNLAAECTIYEKEIYKAIKVRHMKQIVFTGAPGTGKTYGVKKYVQEATEVKEDDENNHRWEIIQFHPSYDYTDFVEGIRPISVDVDGKKKMEFVKIDGQFKKFCRNVVMDRIDKCKEYIKDTDTDAWKSLRTDIADIEKNKADIEKNKADIEKNKADIEKNKADIEKQLTKLNKKVLEYIYAIAKKASLPKTASQLTENEKKLLSIFNATSDADSHLCYFVIDEINRADISKVFGELMYALEYRGIQNRMASQYSQISVTYHKEDDTKNFAPMDFAPMDFDCFEDGFFIPENVIVIGTMNDIDKSVESFDFAMRRRFLWVQVKADKEVLHSVLGSIFKNESNRKKVNENLLLLIDKIMTMNKLVVDNGTKYGLTEDYQIGPSYFKNFNITSNDFDNNFQKEYDMLVAPTLKEYIRGRVDATKIEEFINACNPILKEKMDAKKRGKIKGREKIED